MTSPTPAAPLPPPDLVGRALLAAQLGRIDEAGRLAQTGLQAGMNHPTLYKLAGLDMDRRGRPDRAVELYEASLAREPDDGAVVNALGLALARLGRSAQAAAALERAAALMPDFAPIRYNLGFALELLGRLTEAEASYEEALRLEPGHAAALSSLAILKARRADWPGARARAEAAIAGGGDPPGAPLAHLALAMVEVGTGAPAAAEERMRAAVQRGLPPHERAVAYGLLGEALDAQDRPREAFAAFSAANLGFKALHERQRPQGGEAVQARVRRLTEEVAALPPLEPPPRDGDAGRTEHVFLLGFPRSGTTLAGQMLAAGPGVVTQDERENLQDVGARFLLRPGGLAEFWRLPEAELEPWREAYWRRAREGGAGTQGQVFVDKLPMNTLGLPLIRRLFPRARIVFMQRDPRDVVLSCFRQRFVLNPTNVEFLSLEGAARLYAGVMSFAAACEERAGVRMRRQALEPLVLNPEAESGALFSDLGLGASPDLAELSAGARAGGIATPSAAGIAEGLTDRSLGRWRVYEEELKPVRWILEPWVTAFGYEPGS